MFLMLNLVSWLYCMLTEPILILVIMFDTEKDDITELCKVLTPIEAKWDCFATQLGILPDKTDAIGRKHLYDPILCLKDVLSTWLKGEYNIQKHGQHSWRRVCEATASSAGGENKKLALEIAAQHLQSKPEQTG